MNKKSKKTRKNMKRGGVSARQKGLAAQMRDFTSILPDAYNRRYQLGNIIHSSDLNPDSANIYIDSTNKHDINAEAFLQETWDKIKSAKHKSQNFKEKMAHVMVEDKTDPFYLDDIVPMHMVAPVNDENETKKIQEIVEQINKLDVNTNMDTTSESNINNILDEPVQETTKSPTKSQKKTKKKRPQLNKNTEEKDDSDDIDEFLREQTKKIDESNQKLYVMFTNILRSYVTERNGEIKIVSNLKPIDKDSFDNNPELKITSTKIVEENVYNMLKSKQQLFGKLPTGEEKICIIYNVNGKLKTETIKINPSMSLSKYGYESYFNVDEHDPSKANQDEKLFDLYYPLIKMGSKTFFCRLDIFAHMGLSNQHIFYSETKQIGKHNYLKFSSYFDYYENKNKKDLINIDAVFLDNIQFIPYKIIPKK